MERGRDRVEVRGGEKWRLEIYGNGGGGIVGGGGGRNMHWSGGAEMMFHVGFLEWS